LDGDDALNSETFGEIDTGRTTKSLMSLTLAPNYSSLLAVSPGEDFDFGANANLVNEHEQFVQAHGGRRQRDEGDVCNCNPLL
jgi:hypothetical protein